MPIEIGDNVICVDVGIHAPLLTRGEEYAVIGKNSCGEVRIVSDIGKQQWFNETRFEKVKSMPKYRPGDVITLEAVVVDDRGYNLEVTLPNGIGDWFLDYDEVKSHTAKTIEVAVIWVLVLSSLSMAMIFGPQIGNVSICSIECSVKTLSA